MTDRAISSGPGTTSWRWANLVLGVLALVLLATTLVFLTKGASATPAQGRARTLSEQYAAVVAAARKETLAFLTVDYKNMDPLMAKVLAGATGTFKDQYQKSTVTLKASAQQSQAVSSGKVVQIGISDIDDSDAVVFVAADSQVSNKTSKAPQPRYYRLKLTMQRRAGTWLTANLQFVG